MNGTVTIDLVDLDQLREEKETLKQVKKTLADAVTLDISAYEDGMKEIKREENITDNELLMTHYYNLEKIELNVNIEPIRQLIVENMQYESIDKNWTLLSEESMEKLMKLKMNYLDKRGQLALVIGKSEQKYLNEEVDKATLRFQRAIETYICNLQENVSKKSAKYEVLQEILEAVEYYGENGGFL